MSVRPSVGIVFPVSALLIDIWLLYKVKKHVDANEYELKIVTIELALQNGSLLNGGHSPPASPASGSFYKRIL